MILHLPSGDKNRSGLNWSGLGQVESPMDSWKMFLYFKKKIHSLVKVVRIVCVEAEVGKECCLSGK